MRLYPGTGYTIPDRRDLKPVECRVCKKTIERPQRIQKVHAGECSRTWQQQRIKVLNERKKRSAEIEKRGLRLTRTAGPSHTSPLRRKDRNSDPRSIAYMGFVRGLPCLVCESAWWRDAYDGALLFFGYECFNEACHIGGKAAAKSSNFSVVPLCRNHHQNSPISEHALKDRFFKHHKLNKRKIQRALYRAFCEQERAA